MKRKCSAGVLVGCRKGQFDGASFVKLVQSSAVVQFENSHKGLSFRSAVWSREESAVLLLAASRFLADKPGFGMTRGGVVFRKLRNDPILTRRVTRLTSVT